MAAKVKYKIIYDNNPTGIFQSGQKVSGVVIVTTAEQIIIRSITLTFRSVARINVAQYNANRDNFEIFRNTYDLLKRDDNMTFNLPPNEYKYNFKIMLPDGASSTFYGKHGFLYYEMIVTLVDAHGGDKIYRQQFVVLHSSKSFYKTNSYKQPPLVMTKTQKICNCCCFVRRSFKIILKAPSHWLCPGDMLSILVKRKTKSSEMIRHINMTLRKTVFYNHPKLPTLNLLNKYIIAEVNTSDRELLAGNTFSLGLKIPVTQPSALAPNKFFSIEYHAKVSIELYTLCNDNFKFEFPVVIALKNLDEAIETADQEKLTIETKSANQFPSTLLKPVHTFVSAPVDDLPPYPIEENIPLLNNENAPQIGFIIENITSNKRNETSTTEIYSPNIGFAPKSVAFAGSADKFASGFKTQRISKDYNDGRIVPKATAPFLREDELEHRVPLLSLLRPLGNCNTNQTETANIVPPYPNPLMSSGSIIPPLSTNVSENQACPANQNNKKITNQYKYEISSFSIDEGPQEKYTPRGGRKLVGQRIKKN